MTRYLSMVLLIAVSIVSLDTSECIAQRSRETRNTFSVPTGKILTAFIKVDAGELYLRKNNSDYEGEITVLYDRDKFNYDFYHDEEYQELFVTLDKDKLFESMENEDADVEMFMPTKVPMNLDVELKAGVLELELADIQLKNFELNSWAGETTVRFGRPNPETIEYLKIDVNIGEVIIERLGNANFIDGFVDGGIGHIMVDLEGEYSAGEHHLKIDLDIGEAEIILPDGIGIRMSVSKPPLIGHLTNNSSLRKRGRYYYSNNFDDAEIQLYLRVEMGIGECIIR